MASRFWVGGTGNWSAVNTANWSATSGGAGGQSVPGASDTATFDANSGGGTVTLTATATCTTLTSGNHTGTINTNGQTVNAVAWSLTGTQTRTITLGASVINLSSTGTAWNAATTTGLTLSAASSTINVTGAGATFNGGTQTYGTVNFTGSGTQVVTGGINTFVNLTRTGTAVKTDGFQFNINQTITGTLTLNSNSDVNRLFIASNVVGTARTLTAAAVVISNTVDFRDITGAGAATWTVAGTGATALGDCLGNSGITFTASTTQTAVLGVGSWNWSTLARWTSRVPLPQDDVVVSGSYTGTVTIDMPRIGRDIDFSGLTAGALVLSRGSLSPIFCGFWKDGSAMSHPVNGAGNGYIANGRGTHDLYTTQTWGSGLFIQSVGGTYNMRADFVCTTTASASVFVLATGQLNTNNFNYTGNTFTISAATCIFYGGTSTFNITQTAATTVWNVAVTTALLFAENMTIVISNASANTRTFSGGNESYGTLRYSVASSPGTLLITGNNDFKTLDIPGGRLLQLTTATSTGYGSITDGQDYGYNYFPGVASNYASLPDSAPLSITGDIDVMTYIAADDWTPAAINYIAGKFTSAGNQGSWTFALNTDGTLFGQVTPDGTLGSLLTILSTAATGFTDGTGHWVRWTIDVNDGGGNRVSKFYKSDDAPTTAIGSISWTQLGTTITTAGATSIFDSTAIMEIASAQIGAAATFVGKYYRCVVKNGYDGAGTVQLDVDFTTKAVGADTFTESSANAATVTMVGNLAQVGDGRLAIASTTATPAILAKATLDPQNNYFFPIGLLNTYDHDYINLPGVSGNYVRAGDASGFAITDLDVRAKLNMVDWTPSDESTIVGQFPASTSGQRSYRLYIGTNGTISLQFSENGSTLKLRTSTDSVGAANGADKWVRCTVDIDNGSSQDVTKFYTSDDGETWTQLGDTLTVAGPTSFFNSDYPMEIGIRQGNTEPLAGKVYEVEVRDGIDGTIVANPIFNKRINSNDYMHFTNITSQASYFYAGANSADGGGNSGIIFTLPPNPVPQLMSLGVG